MIIKYTKYIIPVLLSAALVAFGGYESKSRRVGVIDHGRFLAIDSVDNLIAQHGGKHVVTAMRSTGELRVESDDPLEECIKLQRAGDILSLRVDRPDLERGRQTLLCLCVDFSEHDIVVFF